MCKCPLCGEELFPLRLVVEVPTEKVYKVEEENGRPIFYIGDFNVNIEGVIDLVCSKCKSTVQSWPYKMWPKEQEEKVANKLSKLSPEDIQELCRRLGIEF